MNDRILSGDRAKEVFDTLADCIQTEVETLNGSIVLYTDEPLTDDEKNIFKSYTRKEIGEIIKQDMGFESFKIQGD